MSATGRNLWETLCQGYKKAGELAAETKDGHRAASIYSLPEFMDSLFWKHQFSGKTSVNLLLQVHSGSEFSALPSEGFTHSNCRSLALA